MILNHILALLSLVAAAISGTEAIVQFTISTSNNQAWYTSGKAWLMLGVFLFSSYFYIRFKKARRAMMQQGKR